MARYQQQTKTRSLREDVVKPPESVPTTHRLCIVALMDGLVHAGMAFTCGKWTRSGRIKFSVYTDDERVETFLDAQDNPNEWLRDTAGACFSKALADEVCARVAPGTALGGPRAAKTSG